MTWIRSEQAKAREKVAEHLNDWLYILHDTKLQITQLEESIEQMRTQVFGET